MAFNDNREFIKALEKTGDVVHITHEVDWDVEIGAFVRRTCERRGPALLFENIKDYQGHRILGAPLATYRRLAIAMGLNPETSIRDLHEEYEKRQKNPIKPVIVKDGPCKENIVRGKDVDLYNLPAPVVHGGDGGRYIGTWHLVVNKDPDSDWANWGLYRVMIHNKNHLTGLIVHEINQSGVIYYNKYVPQNKPMPVAIVIGADPLCVAMAADPIAMNLSEADYAGGLRQAPVELIKCETSDLLVPAHAEIVIEGEMSPEDVRVHEGPFGEYPGYRTQSVKARNVMKVTAITYRNNPILTMTNMGVPVDEGALIGTVTTAIRLKERLRRKGVPAIDVYLPPETAAHIAFVSVPANHAPDVAVQVREAMIARRSQVPKAIVVDEDVDVYDVGQVIHAFATKCHPIRGITARAHHGSIDLTPFLAPDERFKGDGATAVFDCTWPVDWSVDFDRCMRVSFNEVYPKEVKDKVLKKWDTYGLK